MRVLITGARSPAAVEWAALLLRQGNHQVWLADSTAMPLGRFMRGTQGYLRYASPRFSTPECAQQIEAFCLEQQIDFIIPTCEEIFHIASSLPAEITLFAPAFSQLKALHNKYDAMSLLFGLGKVYTPETILIMGDQNLTQYSNYLLKPVYSRFGESVLAPGSDRTACKPTPERPWVAQQWLEGEPLCNYAIFEHGKMIAHQVYRPLWGLNGSASTTFEPVEQLDLTEFSRQFGKKFHYHGQVAFDFISTQDGLYVIECNPRATSGLHLLAEGLQLDTYGQWHYQATPQQTQHIGAGILLLFSGYALKNGCVTELISNYRKGKSILTHAKLRPLARLLSMASLGWQSWRQGISLTAASTWDIEWNG